MRRDPVEIRWSDGRSDPSRSPQRTVLVRERHADEDFHRAALDGLAQGSAARGWSDEAILEAISNFHTDRHRPPGQRDFRNANRLPGYGTVWRRYGSARKALDLALGSRTRPSPDDSESTNDLSKRGWRG